MLDGCCWIEYSSMELDGVGWSTIVGWSTFRWSTKYLLNSGNSENSFRSAAAAGPYPSNSLKPLERSEKSVAPNEPVSKVSHFFERMPNAIADAVCL